MQSDGEIFPINFIHTQQFNSERFEFHSNYYVPLNFLFAFSMCYEFMWIFHKTIKYPNCVSLLYQFTIPELQFNFIFGWCCADIRVLEETWNMMLYVKKERGLDIKRKSFWVRIDGGNTVQLRVNLANTWLYVRSVVHSLGFVRSNNDESAYKIRICRYQTKATTTKPFTQKFTRTHTMWTSTQKLELFKYLNNWKTNHTK